MRAGDGAVIRLANGGSVCEDTIATQNDRGIQARASTNIVVRDVAGRSTDNAIFVTNHVLPAGIIAGPIVVIHAARTRPYGNIEF